MSTPFRIYKLRPLQGIGLFDMASGHILVRRLLQADPLAALLAGEDDAAKLAALREALDSGEYAIILDQPDDPFFREGSRVPFALLLSHFDAPGGSPRARHRG